MYTLHASYPVRRIAWRPDYETELAIASNFEAGLFLTSQNRPSSSASLSSKEQVLSTSATGNTSGFISTDSSFGGLDSENRQQNLDVDKQIYSGDMIEIWDVRRQWIAKWRVLGSGREGGVTGKHALNMKQYV